MAINLCNSAYKTQVWCDTVTSDGFEPENLISPMLQTRRNGFLAERFVKPPVTVTFQFFCAVDISRIILNTVVGAQKSISFEILTRASTGKDPSNRPDNNEFERIARASVGRSNMSRVCFKNRTYRARGVQNEEQSEHNYEEMTLSQDLHSSNWQFVGNVSHLSVRITQTSGGCVCCLGSVEIWGHVARTCSSVVHQQFNKLISEHNLANKIHRTSETAKRPNKHKPKHNSSETPSLIIREGVEVPTDFIDPITCDIMVLPILLPSGHTVDQTTLDKHIAAEAIWGRPPSDPFTGVTFREGNKPSLTPHLKARIDNFLLLYGEKFPEVARTIGGSVGSSGKISSLVSNSITKTNASTTIEDRFDQKSIFSSGPETSNGDITNIHSFTGATEMLNQQDESKGLTTKSIASNSQKSVFAVQMAPPNLTSFTDEPKCIRSRARLRNSLLQKHNSDIYLDSTDDITVLNNSSSVKSVKITSVKDTETSSSTSGENSKPILEIDLTDDDLPTCTASLKQPYKATNKRSAINYITNNQKRTNNVDFQHQKVSSRLAHEAEVSTSLEHALHSTLSGLASFTKFSDPPQHNNLKNLHLCVHCGCDGNTALFQLPCKHLMCRPCLVIAGRIDSPRCSSCLTQFSKSEPIRFHAG